jgi:hypothetical protein
MRFSFKTLVIMPGLLHSACEKKEEEEEEERRTGG